MKKVTLTIYRFNELPPKAKDYALRTWDKYNNHYGKFTLTDISQKLQDEKYYFKQNGETYWGIS